MPLSTLQETPRDVPRKTQGQDGFATSFPVGLLHPLQHAGLSRRSSYHRPADAVWMIPGSTRWSGTYNGKASIARNLLGPLTAELKSLGEFEIDNVIAEGDYVVVQGRVTGRVTQTGQQYNNTYCLVYEIVAGKIRRHTEYCDTELITKAFGPEPHARCS